MNIHPLDCSGYFENSTRRQTRHSRVGSEFHHQLKAAVEESRKEVRFDVMGEALRLERQGEPMIHAGQYRHRP